MKNYNYTLIDIVVGCVATIVVAFFIIVACASTLHENGIHIEEAKDAALALKPLAGNLASTIFAFGLLLHLYSQPLFFLLLQLFMFAKLLALKQELTRNGAKQKSSSAYIQGF